jgi:ring-1,2-phenylacetyl-CoA epoxidase subunit PaaC
MFDAAPFENASLLKSIEGLWLENVKATLEEANLTIPEKTFMQKGGKAGIHTEHFGYMLAEMQYLQRTYPNAVW